MKGKEVLLAVDSWEPRQAAQVWGLALSLLKLQQCCPSAAQLVTDCAGKVFLSQMLLKWWNLTPVG